MCQAIVKPAGFLIDKSILELAWAQNNDGAGFAVKNSNNTITIHKGFFKFKHFWKMYQHYEHLDCLIHFRYATHGTKDAENCHPFPIGDEAAMIHNGILNHFLPSALDKKSDTRILIEDFIVPAWKASKVSVHEFLTQAGTHALIESLVAHNKLACLTTTGFIIFHEILGEWSGGVWYSAGLPMPELAYSYPRMYRSGMVSVDAPFAFSNDDDEWEREWWERWTDETDNGEEIALCILCNKTGPLVHLGADMYCEQCWGEYTNLSQKES